jgi:hypothetical protein
MEFKFQPCDNRRRWTEDLNVSFEGSTVTVSAGIFVDKGNRHEFPEVSFDVDRETDSVYGLFVVKNGGDYVYELIQAIDGFPVYKGGGKLIHTYVWLDIPNSILTVFPINKKENVEPGVVPDETEPENPTRQS